MNESPKWLPCEKFFSASCIVIGRYVMLFLSSCICGGLRNAGDSLSLNFCGLQITDVISKDRLVVAFFCSSFGLPAFRSCTAVKIGAHFARYAFFVDLCFSATLF